MLFDPRYVYFDVDHTLWLGALMLASGHQVDVIPDALDDVIAAYFRLFPPLVRA